MSVGQSEKAYIQELTVAVCFILLLVPMIFGTVTNMTAIVRLLLASKLRKNHMTIVHLLFVGMVTCLLLCPLELTQLLNHHFQLGMMGLCHVKMFLQVLIQVATFSCTLVIGWERLQRIRNQARLRSRRHSKKYLLLSFLWVFIIPYALYNLVTNINTDASPFLLQACQGRTSTDKHSDFISNILLPLLFLLCLVGMAAIYCTGCLMASKYAKAVKVKSGKRVKRRNNRKKSAFSPADTTDSRIRDFEHSNEEMKETITKVKTEENSEKEVSLTKEKDAGASNDSHHTSSLSDVATTDILSKAPSQATNNSLGPEVNPLGADVNLTSSTLPAVARPGLRQVLNPLRHLRMTAGSSWRTVKDAICNKKLKDMAAKETGNVVKKLRPELFRTESSWSLIGESAVFEHRDIKNLNSDKERKSFKRKNKLKSQPWRLLNMSTDVDTVDVDSCETTDRGDIRRRFQAGRLPYIASESEDNADSAADLETGNEVDPMNPDTNLQSENTHEALYKYISAKSKRKMFGSTTSSCSVVSDSDNPPPNGDLQLESEGREDDLHLSNEKGRCVSETEITFTSKTLVSREPQGTEDDTKQRDSDEKTDPSNPTDEIISGHMTDQQGNSVSTPTIRITKPSTATMERKSQPSGSISPLTPQSFDTDAISAFSYSDTSQGWRSPGSVRSYMSNLPEMSAHATRSGTMWTQSTVSTMVNRSVKLVALFLVCFLPVSIVHTLTVYLSPKAMVNIYPFVCCIEYAYFAFVPILYVFTNKSMKDDLFRK